VRGFAFVMPVMCDSTIDIFITLTLSQSSQTKGPTLAELISEIRTDPFGFQMMRWYFLL